MALKRKISKLDEVAAGVQDFYTLQDDGSYLLDAEGEDVSGIKSALEKERDNADKHRKELAKMRDQFKGINLEEYNKILKEAELLKNKEMIDSGKIDEVIAQRLAKAQHEWETEKTELSTQAQALRKQLHKELIENRLNELAVKKGVRATAMRDVKLRGQHSLRVGESGEVEVFDGEKVLYGKDPTKLLSIEEWFEDESKEAPQWFDGSAGAGAPTGGNQAPSRGGRFVLTRAEANNPQRYRMMKEQAQKVGAEMEITD